MKILNIAAFVLVIAGALNWLLVGLIHFNVVLALFGGVPLVERAIYVLVGVAGVYLAARKYRLFL